MGVASPPGFGRPRVRRTTRACVWRSWCRRPPRPYLECPEATAFRSVLGDRGSHAPVRPREVPHVFLLSTGVSVWCQARMEKTLANIGARGAPRSSCRGGRADFSSPISWRNAGTPLLDQSSRMRSGPSNPPPCQATRRTHHWLAVLSRMLMKGLFVIQRLVIWSSVRIDQPGAHTRPIGQAPHAISPGARAWPNTGYLKATCSPSNDDRLDRRLFTLCHCHIRSNANRQAAAVTRTDGRARI